MEQDTFSFLDSNFSSLVSIFAALMGMTYPLILQAIQRIDEMYKSTRLAVFFRRQWFVKLFQILLLVAIPVSIAAPFVLHYCPDLSMCITAGVIHAIVVFFLICSAVILFYYMLMTTNPEEFLSYLKRKLDGKNPPLVEIFQIMKFASDREDDKLFNACSKCIRDYFYAYRRKEKPEGESVVRIMLLELLRQHAKRDNHFFSSRNIIAPYFFSTTERIDLTDYEYCYIWQTVDTVVQVDNESWIYSYWTYADQYFRFILNANVEDEESFREQQERFREQHFMVGALLVYNRKYELLHRLMYFSNTRPQQFFLVPSTFCAIYAQLDKLLSYLNLPLVLTQRYSMIGAPQDVSSDDFIAHQAYRYAALLIIRLFTVNNWNYTYSEPMELPSIDKIKTVEQLDAEISKMNNLKGEVSTWYEERGAIATAIGSDEVKMDDVYGLCDKYVEACKKKIEELKSSTEVDPKKREYLELHLREALKAYPLRLPTTDAVPEGYKESKVKNNVQFLLDKEILKVGTLVNASNLPEVIVEHMNEVVYRAYNHIFLLNSSVENVRIAYKDFKTVLDWLKVGEDNVVLSLGVYIGNTGVQDSEEFVENNGRKFYRGCEIYSIPSAQRSFIVLQKADLPYIKLCKLSDEQNLELIDEKECFYSNINSIQDLSEEKDRKLIVARGVCLYEKERFKYIRLTVDYSSRTITDKEKVKKARDKAWPDF